MATTIQLTTKRPAPPKADFAFEIDFKKGVGSASRVFAATHDFTPACEALDAELVQSIDANIETVMMLGQAFEVGSLGYARAIVALAAPAGRVEEEQRPGRVVSSNQVGIGQALDHDACQALVELVASCACSGRTICVGALRVGLFVRCVVPKRYWLTKDKRLRSRN